MPEPDPLKAAKIRAVPFKDPGAPEQADKSGRRKKGLKTGCPFAQRCGYALECCAGEAPGNGRFGSRQVRCFLYSENHSGRRAEGYEMTSQI